MTFGIICLRSLQMIFLKPSCHNQRREKSICEGEKRKEKNRCQFSSLRARLWLTVYGTSAVEIMAVSCRTGAVFDCRKHTGGLWRDLKTVRYKAASKSLQIAPQMLCVCVGVCMGVGGVSLYVVTASLWHWAHCEIQSLGFEKAMSCYNLHFFK